MTDEENQPETEKAYDVRIRAAERQHDLNWKGQELHGAQILALSTMAMRAPALVAAGGIAAALGFYSANYGKLMGTVGALDVFNHALYWLFLGLLMTLIAPGCAYFSQIAYVAVLRGNGLHWHHPFVRGTPKTEFLRRIGDTFRWLAVLVTAASIIFIVIGGVTFLKLVGKP
jgi:hypothetical protein